MAKKRRDAEAELRAAGYKPAPAKKRGHGDHVIWQRGKRTVSVPKHDEIKIGTWSGIEKQAGSGGATGSGQRNQPVTKRHGKKRGRARD